VEGRDALYKEFLFKDFNEVTPPPAPPPVSSTRNYIDFCCKPLRLRNYDCVRAFLLAFYLALNQRQCTGVGIYVPGGSQSRGDVPSSGMVQRVQQSMPASEPYHSSFSITTLTELKAPPPPAPICLSAIIHHVIVTPGSTSAAMTMPPRPAGCPPACCALLHPWFHESIAPWPSPH